MRARAARPRGILRIEMPTALGRLKIVPSLGRLTSIYPELRIAATFADTVIDPIAAGLDAVVRIGEPRDARLMAKRVGTIRYVVCAAPSYLVAYCDPVVVDDLQDHNCVRRLSHYGPEFAPWRFTRPETGAPFER